MNIRPCEDGVRRPVRAERPSRAALGGEVADLAGSLLQRAVDRLDGLLARLEGAQRSHHVDHGAPGVDAGALEVPGLDFARAGPGGGAREVRVALLPDARQ